MRNRALWATIHRTLLREQEQKVDVVKKRVRDFEKKDLAFQLGKLSVSFEGMQMEFQEIEDLRFEAANHHRGCLWCVLPFEKRLAETAEILGMLPESLRLSWEKIEVDGMMQSE